MKGLLLNTLLLTGLSVSTDQLSAQSAQPQNSNQNTTPGHYGTDLNNSNSAPRQGNPISSPGNNTAPGTKPADGEYGNPNPAGATGSSGPPRINSGATGASGQQQPQRYNGSEHQRSPQ